MPAVAPTPIDAAPDVPVSDLPEVTFDAMFEEFLTWMKTKQRPQTNALGANVYANAQVAEQAATGSETAQGLAEDARDAAVAAQGLAEDARDAAGGYASTAGGAASAAVTARGLAEDARDAAGGYASTAGVAASAAVTAQGLAEDARDAAQDYRDQAQIFATQQLIGSSTTANTPGAGSKSFAIEAGRSFVPGMYLVATSAGAPANKMAGYVTSYDQGTGALVLNVDAYGGASSRSDWAIGVAVAGQVGGITTQLLTSATTVPVTPNVLYIIGIAGVVLDMTSTVWAKSDRFAIREAIGTGTYTINFGSTKDRTRTRGSVSIDAGYRQWDRTYEDATRGLI